MVVAKVGLCQDWLLEDARVCSPTCTLSHQTGTSRPLEGQSHLYEGLYLSWGIGCRQWHCQGLQNDHGYGPLVLSLLSWKLPSQG